MPGITNPILLTNTRYWSGWLHLQYCRIFKAQTHYMKPTVVIVYCPKCGWLLRAAYMAQELLTTFEAELKGVTLQPSEVNGDFHISIEDKQIFNRRDYGGFPEIKELKQIVRDIVAPGKSLGHADTKPHHQ